MTNTGCGAVQVCQKMNQELEKLKLRQQTTDKQPPKSKQHKVVAAKETSVQQPGHAYGQRLPKTQPPATVDVKRTKSKAQKQAKSAPGVRYPVYQAASPEAAMQQLLDVLKAHNPGPLRPGDSIQITTHDTRHLLPGVVVIDEDVNGYFGVQVENNQSGVFR